MHLLWDFHDGSQPVQWYNVQLDDQNPVKVNPISCNPEGDRTCRWDFALYDTNVHQVMVWGANPSEQGPKSTIAVSVTGNSVPLATTPNRLRIERIPAP